MTTVKSIAAAALIVPVVAASTAFAAPSGQFEEGDIYRAKNVTKATSYADVTNASACEVVSFQVGMHNPGSDPLTNVKVSATLPAAANVNQSSTVTLTADNSNPKSTSDTATVKLDKAAKLTYVSGSTELRDHNGGTIKTLPDGITAGGVNIGNVGVSTQEKRFVRFQAKVDCPTTPTTPEKPVTPAAPVAPAELPHTGASDVVATVAGVSILGAIAHRLFTSRRYAK